MAKKLIFQLDSFSTDILKSLQDFFKTNKEQSARLTNSAPLSTDVFNIIRFSIESSDAKQFLLKCGLILFKNCIAVNAKILITILCCSKSSINTKFNKEKWELIQTVPSNIHKEIEKLTSSRETKSWTLRKYPESNLLNSYINSNSTKIVTNVESLLKPEPFPTNLSLQKDVFSWTWEEEIF